MFNVNAKLQHFSNTRYILREETLKKHPPCLDGRGAQVEALCALVCLCILFTLQCKNAETAHR